MFSEMKRYLIKSFVIVYHLSLSENRNNLSRKSTLYFSIRCIVASATNYFIVIRKLLLSRKLHVTILETITTYMLFTKNILKDKQDYQNPIIIFVFLYINALNIVQDILPPFNIY